MCWITFLFRQSTFGHSHHTVRNILRLDDQKGGQDLSRFGVKTTLACIVSKAISGVDPSGTLKNLVIVLIFLITACSASALAVAFCSLLEPLSYVFFDILKLMQVSLL